MPSLSFNNGAFSSVSSTEYFRPYSVFYATNTSQGQGATWRYPTLKIMQGTQPSDFTGMTSTSDLSSDVLVTLTSSNFSAPTLSQVTSGELYRLRFFNTSPATATQTGTATWFWFYSDGTTDSTGTAPRMQCMGTVGTTGSGADMEFSSVNIVSGSQYQVITFYFDIPLVYSW